MRDLQASGEELWTRFTGGRESLWYYRSLVTAFRAGGNNELVNELDRVVSEMEQLSVDGAYFAVPSTKYGAGQRLTAFAERVRLNVWALDCFGMHCEG